MAVEFLLDENIEHQVLHRLVHRGYTVEHVDFIAELGKGATDRSVADFSLDEEMVIVTYDDDFLLQYGWSEFYGVVHIPDVSLSAREIADILHRMAESYPESAFEGVEHAGREWL